MLCLFHFSLATAQNVMYEEEAEITSSIDSSYPGELVLIQEFSVKAPLKAVWDAYTTREGWESWAVPLAEIDFRVGGYIKSNYNPDGRIGDSNTIVIHIINYVPERLITLQAEISENFPGFMRKDAKDFYNVICFEELEPGLTRVQSYGIGYKSSEKYLALMNFFVEANEMSLRKLIDWLEGERKSNE